MQRHPVDLLLPAFPSPEGHGVRESAVVEVIAQPQIGLVAFLLRYCWKHGREFGLHLVPGEMDAGIILQVPVHTRSDVHPRVTSHHDLLALLIQFEEVVLALHLLNLKLRRSAFVDTLQEFIHWISPCIQAYQNSNDS